MATGINYTIPYELAIRGALADMTQFSDFKQVAAPYEEGFFLTSCINGGIYAMPETMNFWVLYYRSDILEKLGLEVPASMQDVIDMLPELQMRGLNYYQPVSGMLLMRNFHGTTPLISSVWRFPVWGHRPGRYGSRQRGVCGRIHLFDRAVYHL